MLRLVLSCTPRFDPRTRCVTGFVLFGQDAEQDVMSLATEQANLTKRNFLAYVFHEVRQPFQVISVNLQSLHEYHKRLPQLTRSRGSGPSRSSGPSREAGSQSIEDRRAED